MKYFISRKDRIILSAIDIINEMGIQGLSTKELALRQDVNESALYRHFKNKDAIIDGVLDYFSQFDNSIYLSSLKKEGSFREKITEYLKSYLEYYESYPAISSILFLSENLGRDNNAKAKSEEIFNQRIKNLIDFIQESQEKGEMNTDFTPRQLAQLLMGYCNKVILDWRRLNFSYSFKEEATKALDTLLTLLINEPVK